MPVGAAIAGTVATVGAAAVDRKSAKESIKSQERQRDESRKFIEKSIQQARGDIFKLFPSAQESLQTGLQAAVTPFQAGNVAAQQQVIQGLPQQVNALLGQPLDLGFQPTVLPSQLPQFQGIDQLGLQATPQTVPQTQGLPGSPMDVEFQGGL